MLEKLYFRFIYSAACQSAMNTPLLGQQPLNNLPMKPNRSVGYRITSRLGAPAGSQRAPAGERRERGMCERSRSACPRAQGPAASCPGAVRLCAPAEACGPALGWRTTPKPTPTAPCRCAVATFAAGVCCGAARDERTPRASERRGKPRKPTFGIRTLTTEIVYIVHRNTHPQNSGTCSLIYELSTTYLSWVTPSQPPNRYRITEQGGREGRED
jgi:hypothetical protein